MIFSIIYSSINRIVQEFRDTVDNIGGGDGFKAEFFQDVSAGCATLAAAISCFVISVKIIEVWLDIGSSKTFAKALIRPLLTIAALIFIQDHEVFEFIATDFINVLVKGIVNEGAQAVIQPGDNQWELIGRGLTNDFFGNDSNSTNSADVRKDYMYSNWFFEFLFLILDIVLVCVMAYLEVKQMILELIYGSMAPFILVLALLPGNEKTLEKWFFQYLSVLLWVPIMTIIRMISSVLPAMRVSDLDIIFLLAAKLVILFAMFKIHIYAGMLVTKGSDIKGADEYSLGGKFWKDLAGMFGSGGK